METLSSMLVSGLVIERLLVKAPPPAEGTVTAPQAVESKTGLVKRSIPVQLYQRK